MVIMLKCKVCLVAAILAVLVDVGLSRFAGELSLGQPSHAFPQQDFSGEELLKRADKNTTHEAPEKFITGGSPTGLTQYPSVVHLNIKIRGMGTKITSCGGSLISPRHVVTAAHCLDFQIRHYEDVSVYLGEYNTRTFPTDCVGSKCIKNVLMHPDQITIHSKYHARTIQNDIAMLRLRGSVPNADNISPIALPTSNINDAKYETPLIVTGWGQTERGQPSSIKLHAKVQLVALNTCRRYHPVTEGMLCAAGRNGQDSCFGDSGGPIMVERDGTFTLVGIVSFGFPECGTSRPAVYTNVFSYLNWIQNAMRD